jgi:hypothetical protein
MWGREEREEMGRREMGRREEGEKDKAPVNLYDRSPTASADDGSESSALAAGNLRERLRG